MIIRGTRHVGKMHEPSEGEIFERVLDQGMEIVVLCRYGRRDMPAEAWLVQFTLEGARQGLAPSPIPVSVRDDVAMPRQWPERPMNYGVHQ